jgi:ADP-ribose pyrophosphatase YjhB (NUDIX family)
MHGESDAVPARTVSRVEISSKPFTMTRMAAFNFCPRCGNELVLREKDDDRLRPTCPNCRYTHYANPALAIGVLVTDEHGRICLILRGEEPRKGYWGLPAGFMEGDESAEAAAIRECHEETGLEIELDDLYEVHSYRHADRETSGVLILYRAHITGGALQAGTDTTDVQFFAPDQIPHDNLAFLTHQHALDRWARDHGRDPSNE